jgi:predicted unusual protein kinase regulating ubiquinone biosynthesis (AarF/ABC1/UbiB family)
VFQPPPTPSPQHFHAGKLQENEVRRAIQIRNIVTSLGPAYIKLGQALSIRPDILSPAAMNELQKLCDKVPSFDSTVAMQVGVEVTLCVGARRVVH